MQEPGRSWLLGTVLRPRWDLEVPIRSSPVLCRGLRALLPRCRGLCAGRPVCQERGAGHAADMCRARGRSVRKDGKTALILAAVATKRRRPCLGQRDTNGHCSEGCAAQRHRSAGLTEEEPHPERHRSSAHRGVLAVLPWSRCCVPMKKSCN